MKTFARNFTMWKQIESWEIWLALGVLFFGGFYIYNNVDIADLLTMDPPAPVHMEGKIAHTRALKEVRLLPIPDKVYDTIPNDIKGSRYLTGNKKYVVMVLPSSCPYASAYKRALNELFKEQGYSEYYRKRLITAHWTTCQTEDCSILWLYNNCGEGVCIINPQRRQVVIDNSQDRKQLPVLLEKYKNW